MNVWRKFTAALPLGVALAAIAVVWIGGYVWSFAEQARLARELGFTEPALLPVVLDGLAIAMALTAYAAALDGRPAVPARLGTLVAISASAVSNGTAAWIREEGADVTAVVIGSVVPMFSAVALEVLLHEIRRQVQRARGLEAPAVVPPLRVIRLALAPIRALREWRALVLEVTAPGKGLHHTEERPETAPVRSGISEPRMGSHESEPVHEVEPTKPARTTSTRKAAKGARGPYGRPAADPLAVGREVAQQLRGQGKPVSRRALQAAFRERGHSLSTDRAVELLAQLEAAA